MTVGKRLSYQEVSDYFKEQGCKLLEPFYKNARTKMKYKCVCGNESQIVLYSFKNGNRCKQCGINKTTKIHTLTNEEVKQKFSDIGCELLSEYVVCYKKIKFKCHCGNITEGFPNNIWKRGRCGKCGIKARSKENHYMWYQDREAFKNKYHFKQRCYKLVKMSLNVTGRVKNQRTHKLLGYTYKELQNHITNHPDWNKLKTQKWHIDHIFPIIAFVNHDIFDLKIINALDNLRPMKAIDNMRKNAKYDKDQFKSYLLSKGVIL
jgi:hypothetical protein